MQELYDSLFPLRRLARPRSTMALKHLRTLTSHTMPHTFLENMHFGAWHWMALFCQYGRYPGSPGPPDFSSHTPMDFVTDNAPRCIFNEFGARADADVISGPDLCPTVANGVAGPIAMAISTRYPADTQLKVILAVSPVHGPVPKDVALAVEYLRRGVFPKSCIVCKVIPDPSDIRMCTECTGVFCLSCDDAHAQIYHKENQDKNKYYTSKFKRCVVCDKVPDVKCYCCHTFFCSIGHFRHYFKQHNEIHAMTNLTRGGKTCARCKGVAKEACSCGHTYYCDRRCQLLDLKEHAYAHNELG